MVKFSKYIGSENELQISVANYLRLKGMEGKFHHSPNEGKMKPQYGAMRKKQGVSAGYPDIVLHVTNRWHNGLAIELKVGYNKPTPEQLEWLETLKKNGWLTSWTNSFDEAKSIIDDYLSEL